jgi:hypothetical protein
VKAGARIKKAPLHPSAFLPFSALCVAAKIKKIEQTLAMGNTVGGKKETKSTEEPE